MNHGLYLDKLKTIAGEAIDGDLPVMEEEHGHDLSELIELVEDPIKEFDTTIWGGGLLLDVEYEEVSCFQDRETVTLVFGVVGTELVRRVKIAARHVFSLIDLLSTALPEDGV